MTNFIPDFTLGYEGDAKVPALTTHDPETGQAITRPITKGKIGAELILLSKNVKVGNFIETYKLKFPRFMLAQVNTHRLRSANTASSRAIPRDKFRYRVINEMFIPSYTQYQKGMAANNLVDPQTQDIIERELFNVLTTNLNFHVLLENMGVAKQDANRYLEPFMMVEQVFTATEMNNFFSLRHSPHAQPEFQELTEYMLDVRHERMSMGYYNRLLPGEWHFPMVHDWEKSIITNHYGKENNAHYTAMAMVCAARTARISFLTEEERTFDKEVAFATNRLLKPRHMSPFEHPACAFPTNVMCGNYVGFMQYRKCIVGEDGGDVQPIAIITANEARQSMKSFIGDMYVT